MLIWCCVAIAVVTAGNFWLYLLWKATDNRLREAIEDCVRIKRELRRVCAILEVHLTHHLRLKNDRPSQRD